MTYSKIKKKEAAYKEELKTMKEAHCYENGLIKIYLNKDLEVSISSKGKGGLRINNVQDLMFIRSSLNKIKDGLAQGV